MRDLPDIAHILELVSGADPALAERCRAIAERERRAGWAPYAALEAEMAKLMDLPAGSELLARLAGEIRRGRFDDNAEVEAWLRRYISQRLTENDPEFFMNNNKI